MPTIPVRVLKTRKGVIEFPAFFPVTTWGDRYPIDALVRPYLPRLSQAVMVSQHYARQIPAGQPFSLPLWVDSGGFAALFDHSQVIEIPCGKELLGGIETRQEDQVDVITPMSVLDLQEGVGEVGFTLDFPIPPGTPLEEAQRRQRLTLANARWAVNNRRRRDLPLYGSVLGWDLDSYIGCARAYREIPLDGLAIGGMVPRISNWPAALEIVRAVREETELPLHVFGIGQPEKVRDLFALGVDSVDSSSFARAAADGRYFGSPGVKLQDLSVTDRTALMLANLAYVSQAALPLGQAQRFLTRDLADRLRRAAA